MKRILVATDLSERSDRAIDRAVHLAKELGAALTVLHVIDEDLPTSLADSQQQAARINLEAHLGSLASSTSLKVELIVDFGKDWKEVVRQADTRQCELIVLGLHRERGFDGLFRGTTVERVVRNGNVPVLVIKNRVSTHYRKIVIGVDFSVYSRRAVEFAAAFAPEAKIHLIHAFDIPFRSFVTSPERQGEITKRHEQEFSRMVDEEMSGFITGINASSARSDKIIKEGAADEVIRQQIVEIGADLLVVGTHGRTGMAHAFLGSVAEGFLIDPPCDTLAVKAW